MSEIKVKVLYTVHKSTRITMFTTSVDNDERNDPSMIQVSLKKCLLSISASSPDIICKDHDLSVYTANFHESNAQDKPFIWEGHGLLSWVTRQQTQVYGRQCSSDETAIEIYVDLQPTARWEKEEFFAALYSGSIEQVKACMKTPLQTTCNCYAYHLPQLFSLQKPFETEKKSTDQLPSLPSLSSLSSISGLHPEPCIPSSTSFYQHSNGNDITFLSKENDMKRSAFTPLSDKATSSSSCSPEIIKGTEQHLIKKRRTVSGANSNTKQSNKTTRIYYEVKKDALGAYILPAEVDSWTVVDLGTVIYDRPAYHNQRYIYPVNYTVRKWYRSMVDPKSDTQYTCKILDNGNEPMFEVTADDCPVTYSGPTPTTVWTIIVRRAFAIRDQEYGHNPVGPDFFGLRKSTISKMIQDLPNARKCSQYTWQTFEPSKCNKPGKNRRRVATDVMGGVNYGLTGNRSMNNIPTQYASRYERR